MDIKVVNYQSTLTMKTQPKKDFNLEICTEKTQTPKDGQT